MTDVTDRVAPAANPRSRLPGYGSLGRAATAGGTAFPPGLSLDGTNELKSFLAQVEPLPQSSQFSRKEVEDIIQSTIKIIGNTDIDWNKRVTMLKTFRSLCSDPKHLPTIKSLLRPLTPPFENAVRDLRSGVSREACITVAFMCRGLGAGADIFIEPLLDTFFKLLVANVKVVSLTGAQALGSIYESVPSWRLIPPLKTQMGSKSKEVHKAVCNILKLVLTTWPEDLLRKQMNNGGSVPEILSQVLKRGLTNADPEARQSARESYPAFSQLFPELAKPIMDSLEPNIKKQLQASLSSSSFKPEIPAKPTNGMALVRQGSLIKKTSIPVLSSRLSPAKSPAVAGPRSASAIDVQAVNRATARQQQLSHTLSRSPLKAMGRTNSSIAAPVSKYSHIVSPPNHVAQNLPVYGGSSTLERTGRTRTKVSQSQPGSRSNSPSSRFAYASYTSPYAQNNFMSPPPPRGPARRNQTPLGTAHSASASSSRDTSPTGRGQLAFGGGTPRNHRSRSVTTPTPNHHHYPNPSYPSNNSATAKMLLASREAESVVLGGAAYGVGEAFSLTSRQPSGDYDHSDDEDSLSSHSHRSGSFRSETFSPSGSIPMRSHFFVEDNVEDLINKCGSPKWSERKDGLNGLLHYLERHGSIPPQHFHRLGQTFCRIFMDAHTKVLGVFLDVLNAVLLRHAKDLIDFTQILLNRILTKLGSDLLQSVHIKLSKTLEIILEEMPASLQFSAITNYLCDPVQTPNQRSRIAALNHIYDLSSVSFSIKMTELGALVDKLLEWSTPDLRGAHELRRTSVKVLQALFDLDAPKMTLVLGQLPYSKQDQANVILRTAANQHQQQQSPVRHGVGLGEKEQSPDIGGWRSITNDIQSLRLSESNISQVLHSISTCHPAEKHHFISELYGIIKNSGDEVLLENHRELLRVLLSNTTTEISASGLRGSQVPICFHALEELCSRPALSSALSAFTELLIVRVTEVQVSNNSIPREISKAAENCGLALASNFPPETIVRSVCPIVAQREYPVNLMAIKMLQRLSETCEISKLRSLLPDLMHTLVSAYDHPDSAVRKSSVFAIVAVHLRVGKPELDPYLQPLSGSKLKLLELYIQRAAQQQQVQNQQQTQNSSGSSNSSK